MEPKKKHISGISHPRLRTLFYILKTSPFSSINIVSAYYWEFGKIMCFKPKQNRPLIPPSRGRKNTFNTLWILVQSFFCAVELGRYSVPAIHSGEGISRNRCVQLLINTESGNFWTSMVKSLFFAVLGARFFLFTLSSAFSRVDKFSKITFV